MGDNTLCPDTFAASECKLASDTTHRSACPGPCRIRTARADHCATVSPSVTAGHQGAGAGAYSLSTAKLSKENTLLQLAIFLLILCYCNLQFFEKCSNVFSLDTNIWCQKHQGHTRYRVKRFGATQHDPVQWEKMVALQRAEGHNGGEP